LKKKLVLYDVGSKNVMSLNQNLFSTVSVINTNKLIFAINVNNYTGNIDEY